MYYNYMAFGRLNEDLVACAVLQLVYVAKWQWFEHFYFNNLDAQIHRAGFYRIWGVLVFLPILYFTPLTLLAKSTVTHSISVRIFLFIVGLTSIYFTMDIDRQRYEFRHANGNMKIWGRDPFFISAKYRRENGDTAVNFLLGSGWWGMSRHLNYLSEWITFLSWTMLQNKSTFLSYLPLLFLAVVLIFRISRDEVRCLAKYGGTWVNYCNRVPYLLIPAVY
ncbi:hypothetical protein AB6A40_003848 [Gnathostoma spinigerum]|uniref:7-dehydrocholesterol reductase n=1 Tax=Gnathostoma spinigerum TaxID=75299 RepID=A0ABD6EG83_9BILA